MESIFDSAGFTSTMFYPQRRVSGPPRGARDLSIEVAPGVRLHARVHTREGSLATVLLFHGNGEVVSDYDSAASSYSAVGADLAVVDYRGYGASTGSPTLRDCLRDAPAALDAVIEATRGRPLIVMGRSLGSMCAAELCQTARPEVAGYIFESGIADLVSLLRRRGLVQGVPLPEADVSTFCPLKKLARCTTPTLVMHGADDEIIAPHEATRAHEALATRHKLLVMIADRGHNDLSFHQLYWESMERFIAHALSLWRADRTA